MRACAFLALAACTQQPLRIAAERSPDPAARARYAALAWVDNEYPHDYAGYNAFRTDLFKVDEAALDSATSDAPENISAWQQLVASGQASDGQVHDAMVYLERVRPTRSAWRFHAEPGANDKVQLIMAGVVIVAVGIALMAMSGQAPSFGDLTQTSPPPTTNQSSNNGAPADKPHGRGIASFPTAPRPLPPHGVPPHSVTPVPVIIAGGGEAPSGGETYGTGGNGSVSPGGNTVTGDTDKRNDYLDCVSTNHNCYYGTSAACVPAAVTKPYGQGTLVARAELIFQSCAGSYLNPPPNQVIDKEIQWGHSKCLAEVFAILPGDEMNRLHDMLQTLQNRQLKLPLKQAQECPIPDDFNPETVGQLRFWCSTTAKDCATNLPQAERVLIEGDTLEACVYQAEFAVHREELARKRIDQCARWSGYTPTQEEIEVDMSNPPLPNPPRNGPPQWPQPEGD